MNEKLYIAILIIFFSGSVNSQSPVYLDGFPVGLDSTYYPYFYGATPIIADFNIDGKKEILVATHRSFYTNVYLINHSGLIVSGWPVTIMSRSWPAIAAGDVDNDGRLEAVIRNNDSIFVFRDNSLALKGFPVYFKDEQLAHVALYDLDNDKFLEIIVKGNNLLCVYEHSGNVMSGWPVELPGMPADRILSPPMTIADIDNDNSAEIIIPSSLCDSSAPPCKVNYVHVFQSNGKYMKGWPVEIDSGYGFYSQPATVYKDKTSDSVFIYLNTSYIPYNYADSIRTRTMKITSGGSISKIFHTTGASEFSSLALGNMNGLLYKCMGTEPSPVFLLNDLNAVVNNWPVFGNGYYYNSPLLVESGSDLVVNVNLTSMDITRRGFAFFYKANGNQFDWSPLRPEGYVTASGAFGDINSDGQLDFCVMTILDTNNIRHPILHAWTFPGVSFDVSKMHWPMYAHDRYRTNQYGFIPPDEPVGIQPVSNIVPEKFELHQNYPNPFNPTTTIRFDVSVSGNVSLKVYDVLGREVAVLADEYLRAGSYERVFDGSELPSGVYIYSLNVDGKQMGVRRMTLVK
jgi:hypothetical protein